MEICIICRRPKEKFNLEHVIPDAINGMMKITTVCEECNCMLGAHVDPHLTEYILVQLARNELKISSRKGRIPDPLVGQVTSIADPEKKISMRRDKNGNFYLYSHPESTLIKNENGEITGIKVTVSKSDEKKIPEIRDKILGRNKISLADTTNEKLVNKDREPEKVNKDFSTDFTKLQLAAIKIAYEFAVTVIPSYFEDQQAIRISELLKNCGDFNVDLEYLYKEHLILHPDLTKDYMEAYKEMIDFKNKNHHLHLFSVSDSLICHVNIFDVVDFGVILSFNPHLLGFDQQYFLVNDPVAKKATLYDLANYIATLGVRKANT